MPKVTLNGHTDIISVADRGEAMDVLVGISNNSDATADEIASAVSFSGLSVKDTVITYSAFMKRQTGATIISFEQRGRKKVPVQLALDFKEGGQCA